MEYEPTDEEAHFEGARAATLASYRQTLATRDGQLGDVFKTIGPASELWISREHKLTNANDDCRAKFASLQRSTDAARISKILIFVVFICFALWEAPINKFMFDMVLKSNNLESYFVSLVITTAMLGLAHVAGVQTRQIRGSFEDTVYFSKIAVSIIILLLLATCVCILTIGRASYSIVGSNLPNTDIFSHIAVQVQNVGLWAALVAALSDRSALILATLNITGIASAFFLAYITHDSDAFYQAALNEASSAQRKFNRSARTYEKKISKIGKRFATRLGNLAAAYGEQNAKVISLKRSRNASLLEDDRLDISAFDTKLEEARRGIGDRARRIAVSPQTASDQANEHLQVVPTMARERR
jgi:hypothetical protein